MFYLNLVLMEEKMMGKGMRRIFFGFAALCLVGCGGAKEG